MVAGVLWTQRAQIEGISSRIPCVDGAAMVVVVVVVVVVAVVTE